MSFRREMPISVKEKSQNLEGFTEEMRRWQLSWVRKDMLGKQGGGALQAKSLLSRGNSMSKEWRWRVCSVRVQ